MLGLCCCTRAFSSAKKGLLSRCGVQASCCGGFSCSEHRLWVRRAQWLWCAGLVALRHVGSSQTRGQTRVPCIGRWMLNPWTAREVFSLISYTRSAASPLSHCHTLRLSLSDCLSPWAVSSVCMRTMCISLMGSTGVPRRLAGIIHQGVSPFMPSDEIS